MTQHPWVQSPVTYIFFLMEFGIILGLNAKLATWPVSQEVLHKGHDDAEVET